MKLKIHLLSPDAQVPTYAHDTDSGMDLFASESLVISAGKWDLVGTGIAIALPHLTEAQVRPRSGLAVKQGITVLNTPGAIDTIRVCGVSLGSNNLTTLPFGQ